MGCRFLTVQSVRTLQYDGIVVEGVHTTVPYDDPFAAVDVEGITIGVGCHTVYQQVVNARQQQGEVSAFLETQVLDSHPLAVFHGQRLIGWGQSFVVVTRSPAGENIGTVDEAFALQGHVMQVLTPDE